MALLDIFQGMTREEIALDIDQGTFRSGRELPAGSGDLRNRTVAIGRLHVFSTLAPGSIRPSNTERLERGHYPSHGNLSSGLKHHTA